MLAERAIAAAFFSASLNDFFAAVTHRQILLIMVFDIQKTKVLPQETSRFLKEDLNALNSVGE
jgi:hypothetical protein